MAPRAFRAATAARDYVEKKLTPAEERHNAEMLKFIAERVDAQAPARLLAMLEKPFVRIGYTEAIDLLRWLVLPLAVGQALHPWLGAWAARHKAGIGIVG